MPSDPVSSPVIEVSSSMLPKFGIWSLAKFWKAFLKKKRELSFNLLKMTNEKVVEFRMND